MKQQILANLPFNLALELREVLDKAKAQHGKDLGNQADWDDLEERVFELLREDA